MLRAHKKKLELVKLKGVGCGTAYTTVYKLLSSSYMRLPTIEEGITCDPFRFIAYVITGVESKGFTQFSSEAFVWWVEGGGSSQWRRRNPTSSSNDPLVWLEVEGTGLTVQGG